MAYFTTSGQCNYCWQYGHIYLTCYAKNENNHRHRRVPRRHHSSCTSSMDASSPDDVPVSSLSEDDTSKLIALLRQLTQPSLGFASLSSLYQEIIGFLTTVLPFT
uniref:Uncharacterized protein n=1 Tax=Arundo donax TaxID=35708 RepID=A0A0A9B358_ARUDO